MAMAKRLGRTKKLIEIRFLGRGRRLAGPISGRGLGVCGGAGPYVPLAAAMNCGHVVPPPFPRAGGENVMQRPPRLCLCGNACGRYGAAWAHIVATSWLSSTHARAAALIR